MDMSANDTGDALPALLVDEALLMKLKLNHSRRQVDITDEAALRDWFVAQGAGETTFPDDPPWELQEMVGHMAIGQANTLVDGLAKDIIQRKPEPLFRMDGVEWGAFIGEKSQADLVMPIVGRILREAGLRLSKFAECRSPLWQMEQFNTTFIFDHLRAGGKLEELNYRGQGYDLNCVRIHYYAHFVEAEALLAHFKTNTVGWDSSCRGGQKTVPYGYDGFVVRTY